MFLSSARDTRMIHERGTTLYNFPEERERKRGEKGGEYESQFVAVDGSRQFTIQQRRMS